MTLCSQSMHGLLLFSSSLFENEDMTMFMLLTAELVALKLSRGVSGREKFKCSATPRRCYLNTHFFCTYPGLCKYYIMEMHGKYDSQSTILFLTTVKLLISRYPVVTCSLKPSKRHMLRCDPSVYPGWVCLFFIPIMHGTGFHTNQVHLQMSCLHRGLSDRRGDAVPPHEGL